MKIVYKHFLMSAQNYLLTMTAKNQSRTLKKRFIHRKNKNLHRKKIKRLVQHKTKKRKSRSLKKKRSNHHDQTQKGGFLGGLLLQYGEDMVKELRKAKKHQRGGYIPVFNDLARIAKLGKSIHDLGKM